MASQAVQNEDTLAIRPATPDDALSIYELISSNVVAGHLLERSLEEVQQHATHFFAAVDSEELVGCGELAQLSLDVAEVRSLVVKSTRRGQGVGTYLLKALIDEAISLHVPVSVLLLTVRAYSYRSVFRSFHTHGYCLR